MADWHRIGQRVICIDSFSEAARHGETVPEIDRVYTIREIRLIGGYIFFLLNEIVNVPRYYAEGMGEATFESSGFRPVVESEADISVFTSILDRVNQREPVDA